MASQSGLNPKRVTNSAHCGKMGHDDSNCWTKRYSALNRLSIDIVESIKGVENAKPCDYENSEKVGIDMEEVRCEIVATTNRTSDCEPVTKTMRGNDGMDFISLLTKPNDTVQAPAKMMNKRKASRKIRVRRSEVCIYATESAVRIC